MFTNFEYITFFSCLSRRNIFYESSISMKHLWLEIIEKIGCSKSVPPSTVIYVTIYITQTDFEHHSSWLFPVRVVLSRWTFLKKCFICSDTKKMLYSKLVSNPFNDEKTKIKSFYFVSWSSYHLAYLCRVCTFSSVHKYWLFRYT